MENNSIISAGMPAQTKLIDLYHSKIGRSFTKTSVQTLAYAAQEQDKVMIEPSNIINLTYLSIIFLKDYVYKLSFEAEP